MTLAVTEYPGWVRDVVQALRTRRAQGFKPRSLGGAMVDAVRNPDKYVGASPLPAAAPRAGARTKSKPEPQPMLLPMTREKSLGMIGNAAKIKLGRAPHATALEKLAGLPVEAVAGLAAAARGRLTWRVRPSACAEHWEAEKTQAPTLAPPGLKKWDTFGPFPAAFRASTGVLHRL
ncbi:hypothetical protein [Deinococcus aerolatus]|uniref:hypothetical protein n=1 Tax=Deinococcus aerolatus TaxID=522487 RepID=UPI00166BAB99|nr:hypothetical protein [Deinococcus aerolatus]